MFVYAYYDLNGNPLYIGQAEDVVRRYQEHKNSDMWMEDVKKIVIHGPYPSPEDLNYFERYYVRLEQPIHNKNLIKTCNFKEINDPYGKVIFHDISEMKDYYYQSGEALKRATYYMRVDQLEALSILCFEEGEDKSRFIRKMFDIAIEKIGKENGRDYRSEAEARVRNIR